MESAIAKGRKLPDWYINEPTLLDGDEFYMLEFWTLDTTRQIGGGGLGPIPITSIEDRGERRHGFDGETLALYIGIIRCMDDGFRDWQADEFKRERR